MIRAIERVKSIRDRVFFYLDAIKEDQIRLLTETVDLRTQVNELKAELAQQHEQSLKEMDKRWVKLVNDPYAYSANVEEYRKSNPEVALLQHLRAHLKCSNVLDIGANIGDVAEQLLSAGYAVYAFEPSPSTFETLNSRLGKNSKFKALQLGVGASDGQLELLSFQVEDEASKQAFHSDLSVYNTFVKHALPEGTKFGDSVKVDVKSLKSLHESSAIPSEISIVKIDTEGGDLEVISGMGSATYDVVMTEFWDAEHYFSDGQIALLAPSVEALRARGYGWHIVIYRVHKDGESTEPRFYCNIDQSVKHSWGNAIFFKDFALFQEALKWCQSMLHANQSYSA